MAIASTLAIGACGPGNQTSTLRSGGPLEVLTVDLPGPDPRIALGEEAPGSIIEVATFCKTQGPLDGAMGAGDPKRPSTVTPNDLNILQVCPNDDTQPVPELMAADPTTWYVRIEFSELLDGSVEDLVPVTDANGNPTGQTMGTLANTQPVTLQCQSSMGNGGLVDVPYDGYYDPSGNSESYPVGPSLVVQPANPSAVFTGAQCQITLKTTIKDESGHGIPTDQLGPYKWGIGTPTVTAIKPASGATVDPSAAGAELTFNTPVDFASVVKNSTYSPTVPDIGGSLISGPTSAAGNDVVVGADFPASGGPYTYGITSVTDQCGKATSLGTPSAANNTQTSFSTNPVMLNGITGATSPGAKIVLAFNQFMDPASASLTGATPTGFTLTPPVTNMAVTDIGGAGPAGAELIVTGDFKLGTAYTFTLHGTAGIDDCPGGEDQVGGTCAKSTTFTAGSDQKVAFTTASMIALNNIAPMDSTTITAGTPIDLTFNQTITDASVTTAITSGDISVSPAVTLAESSDGFEDVLIGPGPLGMSGFAAWPAGSYTLTIKGSTVFADATGGTFSPGTDQVIHFTVPPPSTGGTTGCL